ncbi:pentapeptide repeat-containing protein [Lentzea sp. NPDC051213]|uniref:pentapeptide repeat-containing protein n=1 Tax=Lentzea sp. NPDC051213 TaxID=3364126 RepID=UPI00379942BA
MATGRQGTTKPGWFRDDRLVSKRRGWTGWWRPILAVVAPVLISTAAAVAVLIKVLAPGTAQDRLDAIRTGLAIGAGIGAMITLALALRRQQATEHDATERRLTELYVKAVDQLGSDKPAVRHGGLYALERVAQDNPAHRQTIVDVICAYLRSPYTPPRAPGTSKLGGIRAPLRPRRARSQPLSGSVSDTTPKDVKQEAHQEREVRLTAQRLLRDHLQPRIPARTWLRRFTRPAHTFWPDIDLDLTGATLIDFDLTGTAIRGARFNKAQFNGFTQLRMAQFSDRATFDSVKFNGRARFVGTQFNGGAWFGWAQFDASVLFEQAQFNGGSAFDKAQFNQEARFDAVEFSVTTRFDGVTFNGTAGFVGAKFNGIASFVGAKFNGTTVFSRAKLSNASFIGAKFSGMAEFSEAKFSGRTWFAATRFSGTVPDEVEPHLFSGKDGNSVATTGSSSPDVRR